LIAKLLLLNVSVVAAGYHHSLCITGDGDACVLFHWLLLLSLFCCVLVAFLMVSLC
jgi:hypothetical protein